MKCFYCKDTGWGESDSAPGTFYPCVTCNPSGTGAPRTPFVRSEEWWLEKARQEGEHVVGAGAVEIDALVCGLCHRAMGEHFDMKGQKGLGAWCTTEPGNVQHFTPTPPPPGGHPRTRGMSTTTEQQTDLG